MRYLRKFNESNNIDKIKGNIKDILVDFKDRKFSVNVIGNRKFLNVMIEMVYGQRDGIIKELSNPINIIDDEDIFKMLFEYLENMYELQEIRYLEDGWQVYTLSKNEKEYETFLEVLKNKELYKIILQFKSNSDL